MGYALPLFSPAFPSHELQSRPLRQQLLAVLVGTLFLALSSYAAIPLWPVPITLQTFAVPLIGALYGWKWGTLTIMAWLLEGALGLPVLSAGSAGVHCFVGPTAGYLFAFPLAGAVMGWLAERGWHGDRVGLAFAGMLISHAICLTLGAAWLAHLIGVKLALAHGVQPFIIGTLLKSALGSATLKFWSCKFEKSAR
jgi:biotin transport system substrate-specific component